MSAQFPHYCDGMTKRVDVGDGAVMEIPAPPHAERNGLEWSLRYGNVAACRFVAASIVESFDYLLGPNISTAEAIRRLRVMRNAR